MIRFLVERPIGVLVSFFAVMLIGIAAFFKLPISLLPDIDIPAIHVKIDAPDLSMHDIENRITRPIREGLLQLRGLQDIESSTSEGRGTISLLFERGEDIGMAFVEVNEKVDLAMNNLPREATRPLVSKSSISDIPVFGLNVFPKGSDMRVADNVELSSFAREVLRRRIEQIPEVAMVDITGFSHEQIVLTPKAGYLESLGISSETLTRAFRENNISLGNILVKDGQYHYYLRFSNDLQHIDAIRNIPINIQGRLLKLTDIADIEFAARESTGVYYSKQNQAINFLIIKQSAARIEDLKQNFDNLLQHMVRDYPNIQFEVTQDQTELLDFSIGNLQQDLLLGGILAFILMIIFIRKTRMAILIGITIPLSLIISQLGFFLFGVSLNIISLGGLILGLSMIIDSSIVVMDNIANYRNNGHKLADAATFGTNEVARPLITSVLTNCAVFLPLIFLGGIAGALFYDQALSIVIGVLSSLVVALVLLPPLFYLVYKNVDHTNTKYQIPVLVNVTNIYDKCLKWCFKYPIAVSVFFLLLLGAAGVLFFKLDKDRLPPITRDDFEVVIDWNEHIDAQENSSRTNQITQLYEHHALFVNTWSGEQQYLLPIAGDLNQSQSKVYFKCKQAHNLIPIQDSIRSTIQNRYPNALVSFQPANNAFDEVFYDDKPPLLIKLGDPEERRTPSFDIVSRIVDTLRATLPNIMVNPVELTDNLEIEIDYLRATQYQVNVEQIVQRVSALFHHQKVADYQGAQNLVPIVLRAVQPSSINMMLNEVFVKNSLNEDIPLRVLLKVRRVKDYRKITAGNYGQYYPINIQTSQAAQDLEVIKETLKPFENQVDILYDGSHFDNQKLLKQMYIVLVVSVLLLYFILAAQFESLMQPLFILIELPIAICGAFAFLYMGNSSLNVMAMIGIVVMSGLIINDSILKIDAINRLRNQGYPLMKAIFEGGHKRIRSIVMISLTSIGALSPTLFMNDLGSELQKPLALALIGGMVVGLFVSLFFVPIIYWWIYKNDENE